MKLRTLGILIFFGVIIRTGGLYPADEFTTVKKANPEQLEQIKFLETRIVETVKDIEKYHTDMKESGRIFKDFSRLPVTSEIQTYYGQRDRYKLDEEALITWAGDKISAITFQQRRGMLGRGYVVQKRFKVTAFTVGDGTKGGTVVDLIVEELLESGRGLYVNFRFPGDQASRDHEEEIEIEGKKRTYNVVYVRETDQKINLLREYLRMVHLTWRRVDWVVRAENARKSAEITRILRTE